MIAPRRSVITTERVEVIVIGGGQAGLAMSYHLTEQGRAHLVLEQGRIAESWRSKRWDSLRLIAPNWSLVLPGLTYQGPDPDGFMGKEEVADRIVTYAESFGAPVREGVRVSTIKCDHMSPRLLVQTDGTMYDADQVVIATGALQRPHIPACAADVPDGIAQIVPYSYKRPAALPPGAVLIVGSGQSGCQIAEELQRAGRQVYLSVSHSWWLPRRYRGHDASAWLKAIGYFNHTIDELPPGVRPGRSGRPGPQLTGANGGHDISPRTLAREGVALLGRLRGFCQGRALFASDLPQTLAWGDERAFNVMREVDALIRQDGLDAPLEEPPGDLLPIAALAAAAPAQLDLADLGIGAVIWATGFRPDLNWVGLPMLDAEGYPIQRRGVTPVRGCYILGLDWLYKGKSGIFSGVGDDAAYLASVMVEQPEMTVAGVP